MSKRPFLVLVCVLIISSVGALVIYVSLNLKLSSISIEQNLGSVRDLIHRSGSGSKW
jgi:hypothetical protein